MRQAVLRMSVVAATVAAAALTTAGAAYAAADAVAYVSAGTLYFYDRDGTSNLNLVVRPLATITTINADATYKVVPMAGCSYPSASDNTVVKCSGVTTVYVYGGAGNDAVDIDPLGSAPSLAVGLFGEAGNDILRASAGDGGILGGDGNDVLYGRGGDDTLIGGAGADEIYGGPGVDLVDYMSSASGVHASLDGLIGDDGAPGEGDTLGSDLEDIWGTCYADVLIGNAAANEIWPLSGADEVRGLGGSDYIEDRDGMCASAGYSADILDGGAGSDTVNYRHRPAGVTIDLDNAVGDDGAPGEGDTTIDVESIYGTNHNDILVGNDSDNIFHGLSGNDAMYGLGGKDAFYGDEGDDFVDGGNGTDYVYGGAGDDELHAGPGGYYIDGGPGTDFCGVTTYVYNCE